MNNNFLNIQTIRRLIRAKRYDEAYQLLKQTNHPQVPALEKMLLPLITCETPPQEDRGQGSGWWRW